MAIASTSSSILCLARMGCAVSVCLWASWASAQDTTVARTVQGNPDQSAVHAFQNLAGSGFSTGGETQKLASATTASPPSERHQWLLRRQEAQQRNREAAARMVMALRLALGAGGAQLAWSR